MSARDWSIERNMQRDVWTVIVLPGWLIGAVGVADSAASSSLSL